jgi:hypothetical protein
VLLSKDRLPCAGCEGRIWGQLRPCQVMIRTALPATGLRATGNLSVHANRATRTSTPAPAPTLLRRTVSKPERDFPERLSKPIVGPARFPSLASAGRWPGSAPIRLDERSPDEIRAGQGT